MAYEVCFHYYEKKEEGGYDTETPHQFTKMVGKGSEEVPLDKVAGIVMAQLARRDVWVTDAEIFETVKRQVSFRETKGGVIIKNKKYLFDQGASAVIEELVEEEEAPQPKQQQQQPARWETFSPDPTYLSELKASKVPLTPGNRYPILSEKVINQNVGGDLAYETQSLIYTVTGDNGKPFAVHSCHFLPITKGLYGVDYATNDVVMDDRPRQNANLLFMGDRGGNDMPVIRR